MSRESYFQGYNGKSRESRREKNERASLKQKERREGLKRKRSAINDAPFPPAKAGASK